jgi:predicted transcriptional regulator
MSRKEYIDDIDFLSRSITRFELILLLDNHDKLSKTEIANHCTGVRTTRQRNLDALEERGWITSNEGGEYRITPCGEMIVDDFVSLLDTFELANELAEFFRWMPSEAFDLDPRALADAQVTVANSHDPYAAVNKHVEVLKTTTKFRALLPVVGRDALEVRWRQHQRAEIQDNIVVSTGVADVLESDSSYSSMVNDMLESECLEIHTHEEELPYFIGIYDELLHIGVGDGEGVPRALVETDSREVRDWAERKFEQYRMQATPLV